MYLLDTNACIDFLLGRSERLRERIGQHFGALAVSAITVAELRVGSRTSSDPQRDGQRIDNFVALIGLAPFDDKAAECYGGVVREVGVRRKSFDRLIGAHALSLGLTLVTNNEADFADIPGLRVENWTI